MVAGIQGGQLAPQELLQAQLNQIDRLNPSLNFLVHPASGQPFSRSVDLSRVSLPGIPFTVKDSFDVRGEATQCGSLFRSTHRAARNSTAVRRLLNSGAVYLGKTNCPELLVSWETDNHVTGRTNNPWNPELTSGGSSGGEAAAIAAFCSPGGIGSDGGGSIRWPAHCTGICGLKPTPGRVSAAGHFPEIGHPGGLLGVAGPMARSVEDVSILFSVLAGYDVEDPFSLPFSAPKVSTEGLKIALLDKWPLQPACRDALSAATRLLQGAGFPIEPFPEFAFERAHECWFFFFVRLTAPFTRELMSKREHQAHWTGLELFNLVRELPEPSGRDVLEQFAIRDKMRSAFLRELQRTPVILAPVASVTAFPHRTRLFHIEGAEVGYLDAMRPLTIANIFGLPALTIPMVVKEGVPAGVQLIAGPYREELLLVLGRKLEELRGPLLKPPIQS